MSRYLVIFDPHAQNQPEHKLATYRQLMRETTELAQELKCDYVVCAGDLWHEKYGVNPDVLVMLYHELACAKFEAGVEWIFLRGNHEIAAKSFPHRTMLSLFAECAMVVVEPKVLAGVASNGKTHQLYMLPWYLPETYIKHAANLAANANVSTANHKVLVSHIGLNEGQLSPSNYYRAPQRVFLNHLREKNYNLVLLGDYHMYQVMSARTMYGGAPIQHAFGDAPDQGLWLLDLTGDRAEVTNVPLRKRYPYYHKLRLEQGEALPQLDPRDYYRIECHIEDFPKYEDRIGMRVNFDPYGIREVDDSTRRLTHLEGDAPLDVLRTFFEYKSIAKKDYWQMGEHFLKKAMTDLYGKAK